MTATSSSSVALVATLSEAFTALQRSRYASAAATTLYIFDIFITLDLEIQHVWKRLVFNLPTILYFANRYLCLGLFLTTTYELVDFRPPLTDAFCQLPFFLVGISVGHAAWTCILTLRASALCRGGMLVTVLWAFWVLTTMGSTIAGILTGLFIFPKMKFSPALNMCILEVDPRRLAYFALPPLVHDLVLTAVTTYKVVQFDGRSLSKFTTSSVFRVLARDGIIYFVISSAITMGNLLAWFTRPVSEQYLFLFIYWAFLSTIISRLVLNLRAAQHCRNEVVTGRSVPQSVTHLDSVNPIISLPNLSVPNTTAPRHPSGQLLTGSSRAVVRGHVKHAGFMFGDGEMDAKLDAN